MLKKSHDFAIKGNAFHLAVGVIIGAAFGGIVTSLVGDIFMPIIGAITGSLDFTNDFIPLSNKVTADSLVEAKKQGAVPAWDAFLAIVVQLRDRRRRAVGAHQHHPEGSPAGRAQPAVPPRQEVLLTEIRDRLAKRS